MALKLKWETEAENELHDIEPVAAVPALAAPPAFVAPPASPNTGSNRFGQCSPVWRPPHPAQTVPEPLPQPELAIVVSTQQLLLALPSPGSENGMNEELVALFGEQAFHIGEESVSEVLTRGGDPALRREEMRAICWYTLADPKLYLMANQLLEKQRHQALQNYYSIMLHGLLQLPPSYVPVWRGIHSRQYVALQPGDLFLCRRILSFSANQKIAEEFILETAPRVRVIAPCLLRVPAPMGGRGVERISAFSYEQEVLFPPYTYFRVLRSECRQIDRTQVVDLEEIIAGDLPRVLLWVDDKPDNNEKLVRRAMANGVLFVLKPTTADAVQWLENEGKVFLSRPRDQFRIITDLNRESVGDSPTAGLDFIRLLRAQFDYAGEVVLYSRDPKAKALVADMSGVTLANKKRAETFCCFR